MEWFNWEIFKNSTVASGNIFVNSPASTINLPIAYFPRMELRLDGQKAPIGLTQY